MTSIKISREQARRFLINRQTFRAYGPKFSGQAGVGDAIRHLGAVQIDPINVFERNHHHALFCRVEGYRPEMLEHELYTAKSSFEYFANALCILPMEDYPYFAYSMRQHQQEYTMEPEVAKAAAHILDRLESEGPLGSRHFASVERISGFWDSQNVLSTKVEKKALDILHYVGKVMISGRMGMQRTYDLPERIVPLGLMNRDVSLSDYRDFIFMKFLNAYGLSQSSLFRFGWLDGAKKKHLSSLIDAGSVTEVEIGGVKRKYYCPSALLPELEATILPEVQQAVFVAPLDNLAWDRDRLLDIFEFDYRWEVYTPEVKRKYGYYVLPILYDNSFVGRIELKALRDKGQLKIMNMWLDKATPDVRDAIRQTIEDIAQYLNLKVGSISC
ncbi:MAG: hypothetical protein FD169_864 [Bacillota bacterium]|nr:MAG: hypothetical protein FD169_864 [Bacillota bacterium]MBS3949659.1 YcaQ family DNA glycosylase [Peptococcaceae bacterium]